MKKGLAEGTTLLVDGRACKPSGNGFFLGPTIFDHVTPEMALAGKEMFCLVLSVIRIDTLDDAIDLVNRRPIGNATATFTLNTKAVREYSSRIEVFRPLRAQFGAGL